MLTIRQSRWLQDVFDVPLVIQLTGRLYLRDLRDGI